jgi:hypothetical protein
MWYYRRPLIFGRGDAIGAWLCLAVAAACLGSPML